MPVFQGPIDPMQFFTGQPAVEQVDPLQQIEEERKRREEEKKKREEEFRARLMQTLAAPAQQPEEEGSKILERILGQRFTPEREQRLTQMRSQTPEDIAGEYQQQFFGATPTSKLGKVGKSALTIGALMSGMQVPNFNELAMKRWIEQQKAATAEESGEMKALASEVKGISDARKTQAQERTAHEKNQVVAMGQMTAKEIADRKAEIEQQKADAISRGVSVKEAQAQADRAMQELVTSRLGPLGAVLQQMKGQKIESVAGIAKVMFENARTPEEKKAAEDFGRTLTMTMEAGKYVPPTGDRTVPTMSNHWIPGAPGQPDQLTQVQSQRTIPGRPGRGTAPGTLGSQIFGGMQPMPTQQQPQPGVQQQPPMPQQPQAPQIPRPQSLPKPKEEKQAPLWSSRTPDQPQIESYHIKARPDDTPPRPLTGKALEAEQAAQKSMLAKKSFLDEVIDADLEGKLKTGLVNRPADMFGENATSRIKRAFGLGDKEALTYDTILNNINQNAVAAHLQQLSGAQVSHQEFLRLRPTFPQNSDDKTQFLVTAFFNSVAPRVLMEMESLKILNKATAGKLKVQEVMDEYVRKFVANMNTAQMAKPRWKNEPEGKQQAKKAYADTATSVDDIVEEVIRRSYPNYKPGDSVTEDYVAPWDKQSRGDKVRFRIPAFKDKKTDDLDKDNKEKAAREALRRRSQGQ